MIQDVTKGPRAKSKALQASLTSVKVSFHHSTIIKRLESSKPKRTTNVTFAKGHLDDSPDLENIPWKVCVLLHLA